VGQLVKAQVLAIDTEKRQLRLSMKQMVPSSLDEYIAERKQGDVVSGRVKDVSGGEARVELGEGIQAKCRLSAQEPQVQEKQANGTPDLSALTSMLSARWKAGAVPAASTKPGALEAGQIRSFRITHLDAAAKQIELELV
jgi:small subunit ribosomal protein S1